LLRYGDNSRHESRFATCNRQKIAIAYRNHTPAARTSCSSEQANRPDRCQSGLGKRTPTLKIRMARRLRFDLDRGHILTRRRAEHPPILPAELGGHSVPNDIVIRRYHAGLRNLFQLYMPIVDAWMMFDNSPRDGYELIASRLDDAKIAVANETIWKLVQEKYA
jgi:hypothetical protein